MKEPKKSVKKKDSKPEKGAAIHEEAHEAHGETPKGAEKEAHFPKHGQPKKEKPNTGFFKNLGKFFRNKGGS